MKNIVFIGSLLFVLSFASCNTTGKEILQPKRFELFSNSFSDTIPFQYSCGSSKQFHPELHWSGIGFNPDGQGSPASFVLIMDDPDAVPVAGYIWNHWVVYDIPGNESMIAEGVNRIGNFPSIVKRGINSFCDTTYGGPCPPPGSVHHYRFKLFAMKHKELGIGRAATVAQIRAAMLGNIIDSAELIGVFKL